MPTQNDALHWSSGQFYALSNTNIYAIEWTLTKWQRIEVQYLAYIHSSISLRTSVIKGIVECLTVANSIHETFPMNGWGVLILQIILTLVLLHHSIVAPTISAFCYHHGPFDYDRIPSAYLGCTVQFHVKPNCRCTWAEHSMDGWYIGASNEHYCRHIIFVKATPLASLTHFSFNTNTMHPTVTLTVAIVKAFNNLMHTINGWAKETGDWAWELNLGSTK